MSVPDHITVTQRGYEKAFFTPATLPVLTTERLSMRAPSLDDYEIYASNARVIALAERLGGKHRGTLNGNRVYHYWGPRG